MMFISKAAMQTGTELTPDRLELMAEDLIDCYKYDSLEDIAEALKKGRQGRYGKIYGKINGVILGEWMSKHLEEKANEREKILSKRKSNTSKDIDIHEVYIDLIEKSKNNNPSKVELISKANRVINKTLNKYKNG